MSEFSDYDKVVSEDQKAAIAAYFLAIAKEFPILEGHPQRVWALGKARASIWLHSDIPEQVQVGVLITSAVEVYPEITRSFCDLIMRRADREPRELSQKWQPYLELVNE